MVNTQTFSGIAIDYRSRVANLCLMKQSESSLCLSCKDLAYCCITIDKSFIWSCSEYQEEAINDQERQPKSNRHLDFTTAESKPELV